MYKVLLEKIIKIYLKHYKDSNKWKNTPCLWMGGLNIINISILLKWMYNSSQNILFFGGTSKAEYKIYMVVQWLLNRQGECGRTGPLIHQAL